MTAIELKCRCDNEKTHELLMDGGIMGLYTLHLCKKCYAEQDKRFLIKEDVE